MQYFKYNEKRGLIFSLSDNVGDQPNDDPQDEKSFYGQIVFKSFDKTLNLIYSKGLYFVLAKKMILISFWVG